MPCVAMNMMKYTLLCQSNSIVHDVMKHSCIIARLHDGLTLIIKILRNEPQY